MTKTNFLKHAVPAAPIQNRALLALAGLVWLAGCAMFEPSKPPPAPPPPAPVPVVPTMPPPPVVSEPLPAPPPPPAPISAAELPAATRNVQNLLQDGDAEAAEALARRVLATEPGNAQVQSYLRQIETDPVVLLGRESYSYVVRPGESLSSIARDRLRDVNLFFALARYNNIQVPRQLAAGQSIRVPGRAPAGGAAAAAPAPVAAPQPTPVPAPAPAPAPVPPTASTPVPAPAEAPAVPTPPAARPETPSSGVDDKARRVGALLREARTASARQDQCRAVNRYNAVLAIDPGHPQAQAERQRSLDLVERLRKQGSKLDC